MKTPLRYPGGKTRAIKILEQYLPKNSVKEVRDGTLGGGSFFLRLLEIYPDAHFWVNDKFDLLIDFWRIMRNPFEVDRITPILADCISSSVSPEKRRAVYERAYERLYSSDRRHLFETALCFYIVNRCSWSGTTLAGGYSPYAAMHRFTLRNLKDMQPLPKALKDVRMTSKDFQYIIDTPGDDVLIYIDPPYFSKASLYGRKGELHTFDHERLSQGLRETSHRFLLTYDDCPQIRDLFSWANIQPVTWGYCMKEKERSAGAELIITNY